jgi:hypothetical protein
MEEKLCIATIAEKLFPMIPTFAPIAASGLEA